MDCCAFLLKALSYTHRHSNLPHRLSILGCDAEHQYRMNNGVFNSCLGSCLCSERHQEPACHLTEAQQFDRL